MAATDGLELPVGITEKEVAQQIARLEGMLSKLANDAPKKFVRSNQQIAQSFGRMSNSAKASLQNVSFQMQDIFVQISGGTSATRALSQQLPQLLSGFGAMGAVFGLVASAAIPVAGALFSLGKDSEEAAKMAEEFDKSLQSAKAALADFNNTIDTQALGSIDALIEKYGRADKAVADLEKRMREAFRADAFEGFQDAVDEKALGSLIGADSRVAKVFERVLELRKQAEEAGNVLGELEAFDASVAMQGQFGAVAMQQRAELESARKEAARLNEEVAKFGIAPGQIAQFNEAKDALDAAFAAENFNDAANALNEIQGILRATGDGELTTVADQLDAVQTALREAAAEAGELPPELDQAARSAEAVSFAVGGINFDSAIAGAYDLAGALASAAAQLATLEARQASAAARADVRNRYAGDKVGEAGALASLDFNDALPDAGGPHDILTSEQRADFEARRDAYVAEAEAIARTEEETQALIKAQRDAAKGGGGGGGRKSKSGGSRKKEPTFFEDSERDILSLERQIELIGKSNEEIATARARWEMLDEAKKRGIPVNEALNAQIDAQAAQFGRLTGELERAEIAQDQYQEGIEAIGQSFVDAIVDADSFGDAVSGMLKRVAAEILSSGITSLLANIFPASSTGGKIIGALFGGMKSFDGGGFTGYGSRSGGIDGKGGGLAIIHPNETVIDHSRGQFASATSVNVTVSVDQNGNLQAFVDKQSDAASRRNIAAYDKAMPDRVQQISRNPRMR